jgi:hypothetical protein
LFADRKPIRTKKDTIQETSTTARVSTAGRRIQHIKRTNGNQAKKDITWIFPLYEAVKVVYQKSSTMRSVTSPLILVLALFNLAIPPAFAFSAVGRENIISHSRNKERLVKCEPWPFKLSAEGAEGGNGGGSGQHLVRAGQELQAAAASVGPENYACPRLLKDAGDSFSEIGEYWTESWEAVTYAAADASSIFHALAQLQGPTQPELAKFYSGSSIELREIASIVGCTSVGPPTAVPNLEGLSRHLKDAAKYVEKCGDECSEDGRAFGKSLRQASKSIRALAQEY